MNDLSSVHVVTFTGVPLGASLFFMAMVAPQQPTTDVETLVECVARNTRELMGRDRVNQMMLAKLIGVSQPSASNRINGRTPFRVDEIETMARFFRVEPERFLRSRCSSLELVDFRSVVGQLELIDPDGRAWNQSAELTAVG